MNKRELTQFFIRNKRMILALCIVFIVGIIAGTLCVKTLTDGQKTDLINYLSDFFKVLGNNQDLNKTQMFLKLLIDNVKIFVFMFILGMFSIGIVLIPSLVLFKGFILGFTIGFILDELYLMGFLFSLFVIFPQNILYIISLIYSALISTMMSRQIYISKKRYKISFSSKKNLQQIVYYFSSLLIGFGVTAIGCAIEAYIIPVFMIFFSNKLF